MTNYEYLKNLSFEKTVEIMSRKMVCAFCPIEEKCWETASLCRDNIEEWLGEEHKND